MNSTNRFLNRTLVFVVGLILLAAGAAVAGGALLPEIQQPISQAASDAAAPTTDALGAQPWILWVAAVAALILIVVLLWFVLRQGRGRTGTLLRVTEGSGSDTPTRGAVTLDVKVAEQALEQALANTPDIISVDVTGFSVRGTTVLRITAQARKGASPIAIRAAVDAAVDRWDGVLGTQIPTVIQIVGGLRTTMTSTTRVA